MLVGAEGILRGQDLALGLRLYGKMAGEDCGRVMLDSGRSAHEPPTLEG
jgi:hypothetical protein